MRYSLLVDFNSCVPRPAFCLFFLLNDTATTEIYTLSLHDALPIYRRFARGSNALFMQRRRHRARYCPTRRRRSEEHTSELQSQSNLVCRLLLEKKKKISAPPDIHCNRPAQPAQGTTTLPLNSCHTL